MSDIQAPSAGIVRTAGLAYVATWVVGLLVFSSSTTVTTSGTALRDAYATHQGVLSVQFVLTQGVAAVLLGLVVSATAVRAGGINGVRMAIAGLGAVLVSLVECGLGLELAYVAAHDRSAEAVQALAETLNRLDGAKMLLLAGLAVAWAQPSWDFALPSWLRRVALVTGVALLASAAGYLLLDDTLALAAWASLPLLLVTVGCTAWVVSGREPARRPVASARAALP